MLIYWYGMALIVLHRYHIITMKVRNLFHIQLRAAECFVGIMNFDFLIS